MSTATSRNNRDAKLKKNKKIPTAPIGFQLHTERLAHERDESKRQKEEHESRQFLKNQQKLLDKKKTEEFARIRLIRPQDRATRHQNNLHQNGKPASPKAHQVEEDEDAKQQELRPTRTTARPLLSARERVTEDKHSNAQRRPRPQSAKSVLQPSVRNGSSSNSEIVSGTKISVRRLENCGYYNPVPLTTSSSLLAASQSAAQLRMPRHYDLQNANSHRASVTDRMPSSASSPAPSATGAIATSADGTGSGSTNGSNKQRIVVYMRRLELSDSDEDDDAEMAKQLHQPGEPRRNAWMDAA